MSVLKNNRSTSPLQYEATFLELYDYVAGKIDRVPKRWQHLFGKMKIELNEIYDAIARISDAYVEGEKDRARYEMCRAACERMGKFRSWVYLLWILSERDNGIKTVEPRSREFLSSLYNREFSLLVGIGAKLNPRGKYAKIEVEAMKPFRKRDLEKALFLEKLSELCGVVYPKAIRIPLAKRDEEVTLACGYIRNAFYCAYTANGEPQGPKRKRLMREAISDLYRLDRPMIKAFMAGLFSGKDMEQITLLVNDSTRLLQAVAKSDDALGDKLPSE